MISDFARSRENSSGERLKSQLLACDLAHLCWEKEFGVWGMREHIFFSCNFRKFKASIVLVCACCENWARPDTAFNHIAVCCGAGALCGSQLRVSLCWAVSLSPVLSPQCDQGANLPTPPLHTWSQRLTETSPVRTKKTNYMDAVHLLFRGNGCPDKESLLGSTPGSVLWALFLTSPQP